MISIPHIPLILGAYYYTWYGIGEQWRLYPRPWQPILGEYRSADMSTIEQHHKWARSAGIGETSMVFSLQNGGLLCMYYSSDFFAVSWGGDGTRSASHLKDKPVTGICKVLDSEGQHTRPQCEGGLKHGHQYRYGPILS